MHQGAQKSLSVTEHVKLSMPPLASCTNHDQQEFRTRIAAQAQGEAVEIHEDCPPASLALAFATLYSITAEVVVVLNDSQKILIFDQGIRVLRPSNIHESLAKYIRSRIETIVPINDTITPADKKYVDLADLWHTAPGSHESLVRTEKFIDALARRLEAADTITLFGWIPALPLVSAICMARPYGHTIQYEDGLGKSVTLFSRL